MGEVLQDAVFIQGWRFYDAHHGVLPPSGRWSGNSAA